MNYHSRLRYGLDLENLGSRRSRKSLLTEGVLEANIDMSISGMTRISLWSEWRAMLEDLCQIGPVWSIVRNGHCVLAVQGDYPQLRFSPDHQTAHACDGQTSLTCLFNSWQKATAFDSNCNCGRTCGLEIENVFGKVLHRICMAKGASLQPFVEWIQMHQATGLEPWTSDEEPEDFSDRFHPPIAPMPPGTLEVAPRLLRTVLITASQREVPLLTRVGNDGINLATKMDVHRASESQGWLVLSDEKQTLYVTSDPQGSLWLEAGSCEGESIWRLSLVDPKGRHLLHVQSAVDGRSAWNRLIQELVLRSPGPVQ